MGCGGSKEKVISNSIQPIETPKAQPAQQQPDTNISKSPSPNKLLNNFPKPYDDSHILYPDDSAGFYAGDSVHARIEEMEIEDIEAIPMGNSYAYPITSSAFSSPKKVQTRFIHPDVSNIIPDYTSAPVPYLLDIDAGQLDIFSTHDFKSVSFKLPQISRGSRAIFYAPDSIMITGGTEDSSATYIVKVDSRAISTARSLIEGRYDHCMVTYKNSVMVVGGMADSELSSCEYYLSHAWTRISSLNRSRSLCSAIELGDKVYVCGGLRERTIEVYQDGSWKLLDVILPIPLNRVGLGPTSSVSFLISGGEQAGVNYSLLTWEFDVRKHILKEKESLQELAWFLNGGTYKNGEMIIYGAGRGYSYNRDRNMWNIIL